MSQIAAILSFAIVTNKRERILYQRVAATPEAICSRVTFPVLTPITRMSPNDQSMYAENEATDEESCCVSVYGLSMKQLNRGLFRPMQSRATHPTQIH